MNYHNVSFEAAYGTPKQLPISQFPEIVFVGRSNVGKSSLINKIFNQKGLARVSATPGKTATINFYCLEHLRFVDLPGYGYAKVSRGEKRRWADLIDGYFRWERNIRLVFSLVDVRHPPSVDDIMMLNFLIDNKLPFVVILTKIDKLSKSQLTKRLEEFRQEMPCGEQLILLPVSGISGVGVKEIRSIIDEIALEDSQESQDMIQEGE